MPTHVSQRPAGGLWHHRAFMLFWSGETVSLFGTQVTLLALPLTAVLALHATATQLGLIRFIGAVPYVLCTLIFGAWVDRRRRKPVLILANAARAVLIGLVPLLAVLHMLRLSLLGVVAFAVGVFAVLFDVSWLSYVPALIQPEELVDANGKVATSSYAAEVAGPGLGGVLVQVLSAPLALLADAISYVVAVITLLLIRQPERAPQARNGQRGNLRAEIAEGLRVVAGDSYLRSITVMSGLWNFLSGIADTNFLLYAVRERALQPGALGAVFAIGAVGGLIGSAISTRLGRRGTFGPVLGIAFTFGCVPWVLFPSVSGSQGVEIAGFAVAEFLVHVGVGLWGVLTLSLRQAITPLHLLGRVSGSMRMVSYGLGALGMLASGFIGTQIGLRAALWLAALGFLIILAITLLATPLPRLRALPMAPAEPGDATEPRDPVMAAAGD